MHETQNKIRTFKPEHKRMQRYAFTALLHYTCISGLFIKIYIGRYSGCQRYSLVFERYKLQFEQFPFVLIGECYEEMCHLSDNHCLKTVLAAVINVVYVKYTSDSGQCQT
jgi:hypothetical protein